MSTAVEGDAIEEVVSLELPAPPGWKKKFFLMQGGATPKKREIVFTSPTGDEISNKRQLDRYLKEHPGSPAASRFDWGTGEAPRRSSRISEKTKAFSPPEHGLPKKRRTKLAASKTITEKDADSQIEEDLKEDKEEKGAPREDLEGKKPPSGSEEEIEDKLTGESDVTVNDRKGTEGEKDEEKAEANAPISEEREEEEEGEERENGKINELGENKVEVAVKEKDEEHSGRSKEVEGDVTVENGNHGRKVGEVEV